MLSGSGTSKWTRGGRTPREVISLEGAVLCGIFAMAGIGSTVATHQPAWAVAGMLIGFYLLFAVKVADQWERAAVLRFGRYTGMRGPGLYFIIPLVEKISRYVDQRIRVTDVTAESALTRDTVPVNVVAIVFWMVWDAEKSILEVEDFGQAVQMSAQTALLESIGRHQLAQMITERESLGKELQSILDPKPIPGGLRCNRWRSAMCIFRRRWKTRCRARRRRNGNGRRASCWARRRRRFRRSLRKHRWCTRITRSRCIFAP